MFIHLSILGILLLDTAALSLVPECDPTIANRPGILVLIVATAICSFVSIVGSVLVRVLPVCRGTTTTGHVSTTLHILLSVFDIFIGLSFQ